MKTCYTVVGDKAFRLRKRSGARVGEVDPQNKCDDFPDSSVCFIDHDIGAISSETVAIQPEDLSAVEEEDLVYQPF
jgi:hypothetical protein